MIKLLITAYMPVYVVYLFLLLAQEGMWIRLKGAGGVVNRQQYGRKEESDPYRQGDNQNRLYKRDKGINGAIYLPLVELGKALQDVPELPGLLPNLEHLHHDCRDFSRVAGKGL